MLKHDEKVTLPETRKQKPLKIDGWKKMFPFGGVLSIQVLRHVSFKVGSNTQIYTKVTKVPKNCLHTNLTTARHAPWGDRYIAPPDPDVPSLAPNTEEAEFSCPTGRADVRWILRIQMRDMVCLV